MSTQNTNHPIRIAAYCRVATEDATMPINLQKFMIDDYVQQHFPNATLCHYADCGYSGGTLDRDTYQMMRRSLMEGKYDILIIKDLTRLSRNTFHLCAELDAFRNAGVRFISIQDNIDTESRKKHSLLDIYDYRKMQVALQQMSELTKAANPANKRPG